MQQPATELNFLRATRSAPRQARASRGEVGQLSACGREAWRGGRGEANIDSTGGAVRESVELEAGNEILFRDFQKSREAGGAGGRSGDPNSAHTQPAKIASRSRARGRANSA